MDDLISRQEVLTFIEKSVSEYGNRYSVDMLNMWGLFTHVVKDMPSAQKKGHWTFKPIFPNDTSEFPMGCLECSECGSKHANATPCNFCDNCGADMRGEDDG